MRGSSSSSSLSNPFPPTIQALESRQLLTITLADGVLTIDGTSDAETISVQLNDAGRIAATQGETTRRFDAGDVERIVVRGKGGDDDITVANNLDIRALLRGGGGNDTILGGGGRDRIVGGSGNDRLRGRASDDTVTGSSGADQIFGNAGTDQLFGNKGDDLVRGNSSPDLLYGGAGDDRVIGNGGADILAGDNEDDLALQGDPDPATPTGADELIGGKGADILLAHRGDDTLTGGGGGDVFDARDGNDTLTDRDNTETIPRNAVFDGTIVSRDEVTLRIIVDGDDVLIPSGAGELPGGTSAAEATDNDGTIEFRDQIPRTFRLLEFFQAWGVTLDENHVGQFAAGPGETVSMTVNGVPNTDFSNYEITDGDVIFIEIG